MKLIGMLSQGKYVVDLLKQLDMENVKPSSIPTTLGMSLSTFNEETMTKVHYNS